MAYFAKSPWVIHYDASSCNGCDIEVLAALCPGFDAERFGALDRAVQKRRMAAVYAVKKSKSENAFSLCHE